MPTSLLNRLGPGLLLCFFASYGFFAGEIQLDFWSEGEAFNARTLPYAIAVAGTLVSLLLLITPGAPPESVREFRFLTATGLLFLTALFGFAVDYLGYAVTSILFLGSGFAVMGERRPIQIVVISSAVVCTLWLILSALGIYLRPGAIWDALL